MLFIMLVLVALALDSRELATCVCRHRQVTSERMTDGVHVNQRDRVQLLEATHVRKSED